MSLEAQNAPLSVSSLVAELCTSLGTTLVAFIANAKTRKSVTLWADGSEDPPSSALERMRITKELFDLVASVDGEDVARTWLIGSSCSMTPAGEIRVGDYDSARGSAERVVGPEEMGW